MIREALASRIYYRACCFVLFFVAASASFNGYYDKWHFHEAGVSGANSHTQFDLIVDGTAYRPYVFRQLLPATANWLDRIAPQALKVWLFNPEGSGPAGILDSLFDSPLARNQAYFFRYMVVYACTFLFALLAVYAMHLVCQATGVSASAAVFAPVIFILLFPYFLSVGGYFYDYPELAFLALAVWIALKFDWWWIIPLAALGTWNKESFLLVIPTLYPIIRRRNSRLSAIMGTGVLVLICAAVYLAMRIRFAHNPGNALEMHLVQQLLYFEHPLDFFVGLEKTYGLLVSKCFTILPLALMIWTAWRGWRHLPRAIQRHGQIAAAINVPLFLLFCYPGELRDLSMLYIVFLLLVAGNLNEWLVAPTRPIGSKANRVKANEDGDVNKNPHREVEAQFVSSGLVVQLSDESASG